MFGLDAGVFDGILRAGCEIGIGGGEAGEVVFADEGCGSGIKGSEIETPGVRADVAREEGRTDLRAGGLDGKNAVLVCLGEGGVAGVEGTLYFFCA